MASLSARRVALPVALLALSTVLAVSGSATMALAQAAPPQDAPPQAAPPTLESQLTAQWRAMHSKLLEMAKDTVLPDAALETRPHPDSRTVLEEFRHVTLGLQYATAILKREPYDWEAHEREDDAKPRTRALMVREMEAALAINLPLVDASPRPFLIGLLAHQGEHYGKLVSNYRLTGVVPPVSRKPGH